ncbi:Disease resistance protein RPS4 [Cardamine amara subsp. amara]|uniref:ADP-ribosyl cyclase/cyclic ADP-ribose hydrolase n=1 Tax=Cardamine amara subsp. amara TaxID=228776 RepID=A0ABD0ZB00_CARAN
MDQLKSQVFICFRGKDVREGLLSFLIAALKRKSVNYYVDDEERRGEVTNIFLQEIARSRVVLVIFSENFMYSEWCTNELLTAMETRGPGKTIIPIFYKVSVEKVRQNWSDFLKEGRDSWSTIITDYLGLVYTGKATNESDFVDKIVEEVEKTLTLMETKERETKGFKGEEKKQEKTTTTNPITTTTTTTSPFFGIKNRVQQLKEKLKMDSDEETRVVGVVGMKGIGKTKLAEILFEEIKDEFERAVFFKNQIRKKMKNDKRLDLLLKHFLQSILEKSGDVTLKITEKTTHEDVKEHLLETIHLLVLDDLRNKDDLEHLLGDRKWITQGSKIVIVTSDMSLVEGLVDDIYVVPGLNEKEGLECLSHHAFGDPTCSDSRVGNLLTLLRMFVDYARGNPLALTLLGKELRGRDVGSWQPILSTFKMNPNNNIQDILNSCYDGLTGPQQDAFLDITCFFISHDHKFVMEMVDSSCDTDDRSIIKDLADKFLIEISDGRVEMNGLVYTLGKNLASQDHNWRLWNQQDIIKVLEKKTAFLEGVRGIFLDISEVTKKTRIWNKAFFDMKNLRYLKIYNSCTSVLESKSNLTIRNGLQFSLEEVRYLHWLKFPLDELPGDLKPKNLVDLKLPYSQIKRLWAGHKDTTNLKWVDLSYSVNLEDLSGLSGAQNLQRLNLEGCRKLTNLLEEIMQTMTSLVYLNLRSCTCLVSLPNINLKSLKTLILSDCSSLGNFQMISENLETIYLDGTSLKELPETIKKLKKLVILNMRACKMLESLPDSLGNLQALQEVILSGCSKLQSFPDVIKNMKRLRILLLDGTVISQVPQLSPLCMNGLSLLRRLCLSSNGVIQTLQAHIGQLYHLKFLDLKDCKNLTSIPTLPPNLECFDAHGCDSLTTVANPLAFLNLTDQIHSTFIFSNCKNLNEAAKRCIISYILKKSQLLSSAFSRYNLGSVMEPYTGACFPGSEVPEWFSHQVYGSEIEIDLARHQSESRTIGVVLCAVVSFQDYRDQISNFLVKCNCRFKNANETLTKQFSCTVGGTSIPGIEPCKIDSDHVFVSYTSLLEIKKQSEAEDKKVCSSSNASLKFEVTGGECELVKCEVLKCGFSMVYKSDGTDHDNVYWEVNADYEPDGTDHDESKSIHYEDKFISSQEVDEIYIDEEGSDDDESRHEELKPLQHNDIVNLETISDSDQDMDDEGSNDDEGQHEELKYLQDNGIVNLETISDSDQDMNDEVTQHLSLVAVSIATPSMQNPHVIRGRADNNEGINGEGDTTCFSYLQSFIPCLNRKTT